MMDEIDARILEMLSSNANETATEIGASVGLSIPAVNESFEEKLLCLKRQKGVAKSYTMLSLMECKLHPTILPAIPERSNTR